MQNTELAAGDVDFLGALAVLLMQAGRDRAADVIYAAIEGQGMVPTPRVVLKLVHSADRQVAVLPHPSTRTTSRVHHCKGGHMAIELTEADHNAMDAFLEFVLDAYAEGEVSRSSAVAALAHVLTAAARDNHGEVLAWFKPDQYESWVKEVKSA